MKRIIKKIFMSNKYINMKCCGNCRYRKCEVWANMVQESCAVRLIFHDKRIELLPSHGYCDYWDFDNLKSKDRRL